ncbi:MAG: ECF-type sigma factor [Bacteroidota bacterium]
MPGTDTARSSRRALDALMPDVYNELRRMAGRQLNRERADHTLNPTALVHEAYIRLAKANVDWAGDVHFFAILSRAMRTVLINYARDRNRLKRSGRLSRVPFEDAVGLLIEQRPEELLALDEALKRLEKVDQRCCQVVECRFFAGLTIKETAEALGVSPITVTRDFQFAKLWLQRDMRE